MPRPPHPRPGGGLDRLADRRLPVRAAAGGLPDGQRGLAGHRDRRSATSAGWPCSTWRACGPGTTTRSRCWPRSPSWASEAATRRLQEIYAEPIKEELIGRRIEEIRARGRDHGGQRCRRSAPSRYYKTVVDAGVDIFVIRGTTVSAEHVSGRAEPLNLKQFIYELDVPVIVGGCATYTRGAAPDAHRRRRRAGRLRRRLGAHHRCRCSAWRCRWPPRSPTWPRPGATTWTSPAAGTCT